ncbi:MAG: C45 family autoproteolytic acyltransferase/hydrolase [Anaerolineae bacterium]
MALTLQVSTGFYKSRLAGSQFEIGRELGARLTGLEVPEATTAQIRFADRCRAMLAEVYPPLIERYEGMVEAGAVSERDFRGLYFGRGGPLEVGCTQFAVLRGRSADGRSLVGRNYDWFYGALPWREVRTVEPASGFSALTVTHHWAGSPDAVNEQGLIMLLAALPDEEPTGPGLQWHMVIDLVMETCSTVAEAAERIGSVSHLRGFNYLLADGDGDALVVEATPDGVGVREPEEDLLVATNHLPGQDWDATGRGEREVLRHRFSLERYKSAWEGLGSDGTPLNEGAAQSLLRDHTGGICRGDHAGAPRRGGFHTEFGTLWSLIYRQGEPRLLLAGGHPCIAAYEPYSLD